MAARLPDHGFLRRQRYLGPGANRQASGRLDSFDRMLRSRPSHALANRPGRRRFRGGHFSCWSQRLAQDDFDAARNRGLWRREIFGDEHDQQGQDNDMAGCRQNKGQSDPIHYEEGPEQTGDVRTNIISVGLFSRGRVRITRLQHGEAGHENRGFSNRHHAIPTGQGLRTGNLVDPERPGSAAQTCIDRTWN
jgi:hypothetical protein